MSSSKNRRKAQRKTTRPRPTPVAKVQAPAPPAIEAAVAEEDAAPAATAQPPAQDVSTQGDAQRQADAAGNRPAAELEHASPPPMESESETQVAADLLQKRERSIKLLEGQLAERLEEQDEQDRKAQERRDRRERELHERELAIDGLQLAQQAKTDAQTEELRARREQQEEDLQTHSQQEERRLRQWEADLETRESEARGVALDGQKQLNAAQVMQDTLQAEQELFEDRKELLEQSAAQSVTVRVDELERANKSLSKRLEGALDASQSLEAKLGAREDTMRAQDGRSFADVDAELQRLRRRCEELEQRPRVDQGALVEQLRSQAEVSDEQLALTQRENEELKGKLQSTRIEASAREQAQQLAETMQARLDGFKEALTQAREDLGLLTGKRTARTEFARMTAMDRDSELAHSPGDPYRPPNLVELVGDVRNLIAARPLRVGEPLYYTERDVRLFLAGLAAWRLQLLEGLSGTGKTSLPLAFAHAVGAGDAVIEVQAGWRDRQDLIGHYNTFEGRYEETRFVQALYEAQCPAYADRLYLVVLDEINLSHPEQYFSDLNSLLERGHEEHHITLTNAAKGEPPRLLINGNLLRIPENVWFVGTANQDDTTVGFAEKTYDRAHVQELPEQPAPFDPEPPAARQPLSYTALTKLFDDAVEQHGDDAALGIAYLREHPGEQLRERFDVNWGGRFDKRVGRFIAVMLACGGTLEEAVDHVLATKILRKLKDRHDLLRGDIDDLHELIETSSQKELATGAASLPVSLELLARVKQRLDREGG